MTTVRTKKLSEFCNIATGGTPSRENLHEFFGGSIPWVKSGELEDAPINKTEEMLTELGLQNSNARYFPKNTVLVALYGATVGKTAILEIEATTNQAIAGIVPDKDVADYGYIFYFLRFYAPKLMAARVGGAQPNISQGILRDINVPLPPLRIQKQIASILEKADAAREKRRQANQLTERFLQSAFLEMFGDPVTNPKGWDKKSIAEFGSVVTGSTPSKIVADYYSERDFNFFKPDDIGDGVTLLKSSRDFLTRSGSEQARICPVGSVLTTCIGIIGKVGILQEDSCFNQQINAIVPDIETVNPWYLAYALFGMKEVFEQHANAPVVPILNKGRFSLINIPLPPISKQHKFAALAEKVETLRANQRESEKALENLFNSLMQRTFRGELVG